MGGVRWQSVVWRQRRNNTTAARVYGGRPCSAVRLADGGRYPVQDRRMAQEAVFERQVWAASAQGRGGGPHAGDRVRDVRLPGLHHRPGGRHGRRGRTARGRHPFALGGGAAKMRWFYTIQACLSGEIGFMSWLHPSPTDPHWLVTCSRWILPICAVTIGIQAGQAWRERFSQASAARRQ